MKYLIIMSNDSLELRIYNKVTNFLYRKVRCSTFMECMLEFENFKEDYKLKNQRKKV
jgi:hypothetical protein